MDSFLQTRLREQMEAFPAKSALYCVDLRTGAELAALGQDIQVVSASTIKLAILLYALDRVGAGELSMEQFVPIESQDYCGDTQVFEAEYRRDGAGLREMLHWMMALSDNTATNALITLLGFEAINGYIAALGLKSTALQRKMLDFQAVSWGRNNYTSLEDQYRMYEGLYRGTLLPRELGQWALDLLGRCRSFSSLQRYLPDPVPVLHKPGELDHLSHDAGIILLPNHPYFLGVFTWDGPALDGQPQQKRLIGRLSRMVYDYMKEGTLE